MDTLKKVYKHGFTTVSNDVFRSSELSAKSIGILCLMHSLPDTWKFSELGLISLFKKDGQTSIRSGLKELEEAGFLKRERIRDKGKIIGCEWIVYDYPHLEKPSEVNPNLVNQPLLNTKELNTKEEIKKESNNIYCPEQPTQTAMNESFHDSCSQSEPCVSSGDVKKQSNADKIKEIINYLNQRTGQNYRPTTRDTIGMINARLKEGFTVQDFVKVIDSKVFEWKDTEWEQYLRPKTLFSTKFESYLQAANLPCKPKKQQGNGGYRQEPKQTITSEWDRVREEKKKQIREETYIPDPWEEI